MNPDFEIWQAIHDNCDCGNCCILDLDLSDDTFLFAQKIAQEKKLPLNVFLYQIIYEAVYESK